MIEPCDTLYATMRHRYLRLFEFFTRGAPARLFVVTLAIFLALAFAYLRLDLAKMAEHTKNAIGVALRSEIAIGDYSYIGRGITDLYKMGFFDCVDVRDETGLLTIVSIKNSRECVSLFATFWGHQEVLTLSTLTNKDVMVEFTVFPEFSLVLILLILVLALSTAMAATYKAYLSRVLLFSARETLAKQVAHDIRSPLSALNMVMGTLKDMPEDKRVLIRSATQRINDIANNLLEKNKNIATPNNKSENRKEYKLIPFVTEFVPTLVDVLVSEKRMQYREYVNLEIDIDLYGGFGAFAHVNSSELKRVISNIINNSIEALEKKQGWVKVIVKKTGSKVEILIQDNGKGIPKHVLEKLGNAGFSHDKSETDAGSGLGIYHAKKTMEALGGLFLIDSTVGKGTTIKLVLPAVEAPKWFSDKIDLSEKKYLVSLDDDASIHQIWERRLKDYDLTEINHIKFQSGESFEKYLMTNMDKLTRTLFLVDFELLNQPKNGLQIIEDMGIENYSILVTSRYGEAEIQARSLRLRVPILPKSLAGSVPIKLEIY